MPLPALQNSQAHASQDEATFLTSSPAEDGSLLVRGAE
jgi:hypothetical protein